MSTPFIRNIHSTCVLLDRLESLHAAIEMDLGVVDLSDDEQAELASDKLQIKRIREDILTLQDNAKHARKELDVRDLERASQHLLGEAGTLLLKADTVSE